MREGVSFEYNSLNASDYKATVFIVDVWSSEQLDCKL